MIKLTELLSEIMQEGTRRNLGEYEYILFEESKVFQELADPDRAYKYNETNKDIWEFNDKYGNTLGVRYLSIPKYFESYFKMKNLKGKDEIVFDIEANKNTLDLSTYQGGTDDHRSDTICKILLDEVLPNYLLNKKPSLIKLHPLNNYRYDIFYKCAEVCKEKYPELEIKKLGKEIHLINK